MQQDVISNLGRGSYVLTLHLKNSRVISIGKLGEYSFSAGFYAYVGSAFGPGGLTARLNHHLFSSAASRWHIDYLRRHASIEEVWLSQMEACREHLWAAALNKLNTSGCHFKNFGCSDCECFTHLFHFRQPPPLQKFKKLIETKSEHGHQLQRIVLQ